jgi:hypothetical protein
MALFETGYIKIGWLDKNDHLWFHKSDNMTHIQLRFSYLQVNQVRGLYFVVIVWLFPKS